MSTNRRPTRRPKRRTYGTMEDAGLGEVQAAQTRIDTCERFGMEVDPRDRAIVKHGSRAAAAEAGWEA